MKRILIMEDSAYQRRQIVRALQGEPYELLEADNGRDGMAIIDAEEPDCVLLDLMMPQMGGLEVLQALQDREVDPPVIVLTADIQASTRQQCIDMGAVGFINKPLHREELIDAIRQALGGAQQSKESHQ